MNENTEPQKHIEAARMQLISPPPEEELQRTHVFGFPRTNTNTAMAQTKRKRASGVTIGSPSKTSAEPVEATPNPKPRKTHRRRTSTLESPSRPSFAHANPNADYVPPVTLTAPHGHGRRSVSVTPYEPPPDVFTPPREVLLAPPPSSTRKAAPKQKTKQKERTATPRAQTQTPLRVVVHPTDDPLLLLPSSSPVKATHMRKRSVPVPVPTFDEEVEHEDEDGVRSSDAAAPRACAQYGGTLVFPRCRPTAPMLRLYQPYHVQFHSPHLGTNDASSRPRSTKHDPSVCSSTRLSRRSQREYVSTPHFLDSILTDARGAHDERATRHIRSTASTA
ncbi:hypothetical protein C8R45DRAFT_1189297 [Mycena sanguinolenta]|nr:hypothetical protein C8R45DRAFT_1189297 [Mycena sanguinolenta]